MANQKTARVGASLTFIAVACLLTAWQPASAQTPLQIRDVQVLNTNGNRVCQHVYENGKYKLAWQSALLEGPPSVRIGDIDNDGQDEIVASVYYVSRTEGSKRNLISYYTYRTHVFETGVAYNGNPNWSTGELPELPRTLLLDSWVADVDPRHAGNELILILTNRLQVLSIQRTGETTAAWSSVECLRAYPSQLFSIEVGDADNLAGNEILVCTGGLPYIWKCTLEGWTEAAGDPIDPAQYGDTSNFAMAYLRIRDVDGLPGNEIIATGNNERIMVWKYLSGHYTPASYSQDLNANMAYGIDSGDVDRDGIQEVVLNLWAIKRLPARVVALAYDSGIWVQKYIYNTNYSDQRDLRLADLDGDGQAEVVFNNGGSSIGMKILDFDNGTFSEVYSIPGEPYGKIEIR